MSDLSIALLPVLMALAMLVGMFTGCAHEHDLMHPKNFIKEHYCETANIQGQEYKRCWKAEELK